MNIIATKHLTAGQKESALTIWNAEYPVQLQMPDLPALDAFLDTLTDTTHYLLIDENDEINGWAAVFYYDNIPFFFIMLKGAIHGKGYGSLLLNELKKHTKQLSGWVINHKNDVKVDGEPYPSPLNFYIKNGFTVNYGFRLDTDILSAVHIMWEEKVS